MTFNDRDGGHMGAKACAVLCFLLGAAALVLSIRINAEFGSRLAADTAGRANLSAWHVITDSSGAVMALVAGWMAARRWIGRTVIAGTAALLFACYSASALIGYGFLQRQAVETAKNINVQRESEAATRQSKMVEDQLWWLRGTTSKTDASAADKKLAIQESGALIKSGQAKAWQKVDAADLIGDAHTSAMSGLLGVNETTTRTGLIVLAAILLILAKLSGFGFASMMWFHEAQPGPPAEPMPPPRGRRSFGRMRLGQVSRERDKPAKAGAAGATAGAATATGEAAATATASAAEPSRGRPALVVVPSSATGRAVVRERPAVADDVRRFMALRTRPADGAVIRATALYDEYRDWCRANGLTPSSQTAFGRTATRSGVERVSVGPGHVAYAHMTMLPAGLVGLSRPASALGGAAVMP